MDFREVKRLAARRQRESLQREVLSKRWGISDEKLSDSYVARVGTPTIGTMRSSKEKEYEHEEPTATVPPLPPKQATLTVEDDEDVLLEDELMKTAGKPILRSTLQQTPQKQEEVPVERPVPPTPKKGASWLPFGSSKEPEEIGQVLRKYDRPAVQTPLSVSPQPLGTERGVEETLTVPMTSTNKKVPGDPGTAKPDRDVDLIENNLSQMVETENNIKTVAKELFNKGSIELKSEVTHNEINHITRIRFLGTKFRLENMDYLTDNLLSLRVSKNRKSRNEFISALQSENRNQQGGGFFNKLFGSNNRNEPN